MASREEIQKDFIQCAVWCEGFIDGALAYAFLVGGNERNDPGALNEWDARLAEYTRRRKALSAHQQRETAGD